jgi:hypothetical protein
MSSSTKSTVHAHTTRGTTHGTTHGTANAHPSAVFSSPDPISTLQAVERALAAPPTLDRATREEKRRVVARSSPAQLNLLFGEASESGGVVGGVTIDVATSQASLARAGRLRVGAAAAKRIARQLADEALGLEATVTQTALAAIGALESQSKAPGGEALVSKVAALRGAVKKRARGHRNAATPAPAPTPHVTGTIPTT